MARSLTVAALIGAIGLLCPTTASAQSGGDYVITKSAIAGGGGTATGGDYVMASTIGQHDADAPLVGGDYELSGGFWAAGVDPTESPPDVGDDLCVGGSNDGDPCSTSGDCPGGICGLKNRYISITPPPAPGIDRTIQACIASMPQYPARETECWWAGPQMSISNGPNPPSPGASLQCTMTPHAQEWTTANLHLFGEAIIPGSVYEVRLCDDNGANCSDALSVATGIWGDVSAPFGASQPNFGDVSNILDGFRGLPTALATARLDLTGTGNPGQPNVPNQIVNFADVSAGLDAFRGLGYPYTVSSCP